MLTDLFAAAGLTWHCVLSGELVHAYKPDPAVYRLAVERLALDPPRTPHGGRPAPGTCAPPQPKGCAPLTSSAPAKASQIHRTPSTSQPPTWRPSPRGCLPGRDDRNPGF